MSTKAEVIETPELAVPAKVAARICGVSETTIAQAREAGALRGKRLNEHRDPDRPARGKVLYLVADLRNWLENLPDA